MQLDEVGRAQARAVAGAMAALRPAAVWSSDLARARGTAEVVAGSAGQAVRVDSRLREIALGRWEGLTGAEAQEHFPLEHAAWTAGQDVPRGGGETYRAAGERAAACLRAAADDVAAGSVVVAVTHGGTARGALGCLLELEDSAWWRLAPLGNACWSVLVEADRGWRLERHNSGVGALIDGPAGGHDLGGPGRPAADSGPEGRPVR